MSPTRLPPVRLFHTCLVLSAWLVLFSSFLPSVCAQHESVQPGINEEYQGSLDTRDYESQFEREGREVYDKRNEILKALDLRPGEKVADIGTGTGLFVPLFAEAVGPTGRVYATDIAEDFVEHVRNRARRLGLTNVETVLGADRSVDLPAASIDLAFLCDVYHHFEFPEDSLRSIDSALRPGGRLVVIDYHREPGKSPEWRLHHIRAGKDQFRAEIEAAGFEYVREHDFLTDNYFLVFRKP
jgi:predicted methyltransferase